MRLSTRVVSPTDVERSAPAERRGKSVLIAAADSWGQLSAVHIEALTGCSVDQQGRGASTTDDWRGRYLPGLQAGLLGAGHPAILYMSLGIEEVWLVPGFPQRTIQEARVALAGLVNLIHSIRLIPIIHPSYDAKFLSSTGALIDADQTLLQRPDLYEFTDLTDLPVEYFDQDPLHLIPESYDLRVRTLWARSTLARQFGTCGGVS